MKNSKLFLCLSFFTVLICILIGTDFFPQLRGPAPYPPDWQWDYFFVNTLSKLWVPLGIGCFILWLFYKTESISENIFARKEKYFLTLFVIVSIIFQIAVLYFSRAGVGVLIHRMIDPEINGYFPVSLQVKSVPDFLSHYNERVLQYPRHTQSHPPGSVLLFSVVTAVVQALPLDYSLLLKQYSPSGSDVRKIWNTLSPPQQMSSVVSIGVVIFLANILLIPLYFLGKKLYGVRSGVRAVFLYMLVPSFVLFIPMSDTFFGLLSVLSFLVYLYALKTQKKYLYFLSGGMFSIGLFLSLSLLPLLLISACYGLGLFLESKEKVTFVIRHCYFLIGLLLLPFYLYGAFHYNSVVVAQTLMSGLPSGRFYTTWIFYNLLDFFVFAGSTLTILFFILIYQRIKTIKKMHIKKVDVLSLSFLLMIVILNFSGSVRGEIARIWLPFYPFLVLIIVNFLTNTLKMHKKLFVGVLFLQLIQILVMQEFWVVTW